MKIPSNSSHELKAGVKIFMRISRNPEHHQLKSWQMAKFSWNLASSSCLLNGLQLLWEQPIGLVTQCPEPGVSDLSKQLPAFGFQDRALSSHHSTFQRQSHNITLLLKCPLIVNLILALLYFTMSGSFKKKKKSKTKTKTAYDQATSLWSTVVLIPWVKMLGSE